MPVNNSEHGVLVVTEMHAVPETISSTEFMYLNILHAHPCGVVRLKVGGLL